MPAKWRSLTALCCGEIFFILLPLKNVQGRNMNQAVDLDELTLFRDMARRAFEQEITPHYESVGRGADGTAHALESPR
ncbi:MAG: hypothetical protein CM15mP103_04970 [Gammaproteobacteria bacterium]|nr:MAG: hypothetical protein CM15mP103_04970 [Gammaproteobacteria bacterium]